MIIVTGAQGFIGKALCDNLESKNYRLKRIVRSNPSSNEYALGDFSANTNWGEMLLSCNTVIHLAGRAHVLNGKDKDSIVAFRQTNVEATLNLARQAAERGVSRFIFLSSIGVNGGETFETPFSHTSLCQPHSNYALSKFEAEQGVMDICTQSGMEFVIIRPPLVYAHNAPGNFRTLLKIVHSRFPLPLAGLNNKRSLVALDNLVDFISLCIKHPRAANQIFLVADDGCVSTRRIVELLSIGMGRSPIFFSVPINLVRRAATLLKRENLYRQLFGSLEIDSTRAKNELDWKPAMSIDEGLINAGKMYLKNKS